MTTVSVVPEIDVSNGTTYRAVAGTKHAVGRTVGEAIDALTPQLNDEEAGTLVIVQNMRPDRYFTADQQERLGELMARWRTARDAGDTLPAEEQQELQALIDAELRGATQRAAEMLRRLTP
jgi:hypothetical protein